MEFDLEKMYCGAVRRGDIFLYEEENKEKVVLVLQDSILNERLPSVVVAKIEPHKSGERIFKNEVFLKSSETGLGVNAVCKLYKINTVDRRKLVAKKGELKKDSLEKVFIALDLNFGRFRD